MYPRISQGRRMLGITIDWFAAYAVTLGFFAGDGTFLERSRNVGGTVLLVLTLEYLILVALTGSSFGHRIVGLKVVRFSDGGPVTILQALIRTVLLVTIVAAITFDENGRAPNERLSNTVLVKR
jgi:uncharacterized RDD family membrane protein YckC